MRETGKCLEGKGEAGRKGERERERVMERCRYNRRKGRGGRKRGSKFVRGKEGKGECKIEIQR